MQREVLNAQIKALQLALNELRSGAPGTVDPTQTVEGVYAVLDGLQTDHAELFAKKPEGSASTYKQLYENIKAVKHDKFLNIPQLVQFLRTLRDEQTGGRCRTRRRSGRRRTRTNTRKLSRVR